MKPTAPRPRKFQGEIETRAQVRAQEKLAKARQLSIDSQCPAPAIPFRFNNITVRELMGIAFDDGVAYQKRLASRGKGKR